VFGQQPKAAKPRTRCLLRSIGPFDEIEAVERSVSGSADARLERNLRLMAEERADAEAFDPADPPG